jgi:RimJ/RimL family protein N-acetyltransferase
VTLLEERADETVRETSPKELQTARLILRPPQLQDAKAIAALANDIRIAQNTLRLPHPYTVADAETFIASMDKGEGEAAFIVTLRSGALIGVAGIAKLNGNAPELGYWLGVPFWGHGYATEAARAVIDHAFTEIGCEQLQSGARISNPASRRVLEKCGFQWCGVGLYRIRSIASSAPIDRFRLDRDIWRSLKSWGKVKLGA